MLATHPATGKPIRILRTEAHVSHDARTLVWVRPTFVPSERWSTRWNAVLTDPAAAAHTPYWTAAIVSPTDSAAWISVLPTICFDSAGSPTDTLLFAPEAFLDSLPAHGIHVENAISLEHMYDQFPFLPAVSKGTTKDRLEHLILAVAHILRMNRIVWHTDCTDEALGPALTDWKQACGGSCTLLTASADDTCIPRTWLIQQYYVPPSLRRAKEIQTCLEKNLACPWIDHILLLNEEDYALPASPKLRVVLHPRRLTYEAVLRASLEHVPRGDYVVFANSDMYFDETLRSLWSISLAERRMFLALLRWEHADGGTPPALFGPRSDSQDVWIVARDCLDFPIKSEEFGFPFGKPGCDNALAVCFLKHKFIVCNPAYSIRTYHMHASGVRNYDAKDILYAPIYLYLDPTAIQPLAIRNDMSAWSVREWAESAVLGASFPRTWLGVRTEDTAELCSALQQEWRYVAGESNLWTPSPEDRPLYKISGGVFTNTDGLLWNFRECFLGGHVHWSRAWERTRMHIVQPSLSVPSLVSVPCPAVCKKRLSAWVLHYLPNALAVRDFARQSGETVLPECLVPAVPSLGAFLDDCTWSGETGNITVCPILEDMTYYADTVWSLPPSHGVEPVRREMIARLRALLPEPATVATEGSGLIAVFCLESEEDDDVVWNRGFAEKVAALILTPGWSVRYVSAADAPAARRRAFQGASWIIGAGDQLEWMWYAPVGATVLDYMDAQHPTGSHAHLAGACEHRYIACKYRSDLPMHERRQAAMVDVGLALQQHGFFDLLTNIRRGGAEKPVVYLPSGSALNGIWIHTGDSFREMARIWADRGYIELRYTEASPHCWWGEVGDVLLYDRDTPRWWSAPPPYQLALFGNPAPPGPGGHLLRQSTWCYWPRHPAAIEAAVKACRPMRGYGMRTVRSLFLGKVENGVQLQNRTRHDWSKAVDLFSMPIDPTGKPYPYSQEEYLETLCNARFGLSLPGFGQKCHREIEYFACGCVPIVTDGVDMTNFLVPPVEGVHYFRASTPEQVQKIVEETSRIRWTAMSIAGREWWRVYASAEGLFRLTFARIEQCRPFLLCGIPKDLKL
jgi:hypothetical protein